MEKITELKGDWTMVKKRLKKKFTALTESDLLLQSGKQDEMIGRLQIKLGKTKAEIHKLIADL